MSFASSICVFCGSKRGADPAHAAAARDLGRLMAERGIRLVFGGGRIGLMGDVADAVLAGGGQAIGVIPEFLQRLEVARDDLTELVVTDSMHARKQRMFELSDAFVMLPGGLGTLDETIEVMTWKQLRMHTKPIIVLDVAGYWGELVTLIDQVIDGGFAHETVRGLWTVVSRPEEVFDAIEAQPEPDERVLTSHL